MKADDAVRALAALAQEHRLKVFRLLVREGAEGLAAGVIADRLGIGSTALSFHLKELQRVGLVSSRREGRYIRYCLACDAMKELLDYLARDCCQGRADLCPSSCCGPSIATPALASDLVKGEKP